jgi:hypothetical protein
VPAYLVDFGGPVELDALHVRGTSVQNGDEPVELACQSNNSNFLSEKNQILWGLPVEQFEFF